jgi:small subunit ribosomal protein S2
LNIPVFAMVDTNSDPKSIDFPIPSNDDASKSISLIIDYIASDIEAGLNERKMEKEKEVADAKDKKIKKEAADKAKADEDKAKAEAEKATTEAEKATTEEKAANPEAKTTKRERISTSERKGEALEVKATKAGTEKK